jgi:hypothetical protein
LRISVNAEINEPVLQRFAASLAETLRTCQATPA